MHIYTSLYTYVSILSQKRDWESPIVIWYSRFIVVLTFVDDKITGL